MLSETHPIGPTEPAPPLAGLRVVAVEQFGAGPYGTMYLADLGADVIKVEDPSAGGDVGRTVPPHVEGDMSLYFEAFNRGKRSIGLDLKNPAGQEVFKKLVASADAVYSNLRGDLPEALGLTYEHLKEVNPAIVCVALTGYGRQGQRASYPAYDALIQAEVGWAERTGGPDQPPTKSGLSLADYIGGLTAALGLLARVHEAQRTGVGGDVDVDLYRSALSMYAYEATWFLSRGSEMPKRPMSAHPSIVPFQFFRTSDGHIAIACAKEKFFRQLVDKLQLTELAADPRAESFAARRDNSAYVLDVLEAEFASRSSDHWVQLLQGVVPVAPVRSMADALNTEELDDLDMLARYDSPALGRVESVGLPIRVSGFQPSYSAAPGLGADRPELLAELGIDEHDAGEYEAQGAFGARSSS